jgi:hypothetical protein
MNIILLRLLYFSERDNQPKNHLITRNIPIEKFSSPESMFFEEDNFSKGEQSYIQEEKPIKQTKNKKKKNTEAQKNEKSMKVDLKSLNTNEKSTKANLKSLNTNEKSVKTKESDLNYFDEVAFGDKYRDFDPEKVNTNHPVLPGPVSGNIGASLQDLSFVDEQYLGSSAEMLAGSDNHYDVNKSFVQSSIIEEKQDINESNEESKY